MDTEHSTTQSPPLPFHEYADLFALLEGEALTDLVEDIRTRGLLEPIHTLRGTILDGRNRYRAALLAGLKLDSYHFREYLGDDPLGFVVSKNVHRRHLTTDDRIALAKRLLPMMKEQALARERAGTLASNDATVGKVGKATAIAAAQVGISASTLERALEVDKVPDLAVQVAAKELTYAQAHREVTTRKKTALPKPWLPPVKPKGPTVNLIDVTEPPKVATVSLVNVLDAAAADAIALRNLLDQKDEEIRDEGEGEGFRVLFAFPDVLWTTRWSAAGSAWASRATDSSDRTLRSYKGRRARRSPLSVTV